MIKTPRAAWLAGRDAGHADGKDKLAQAGRFGVEHATFCTLQEMPADRALWPAWLSGYGEGISEAAGCIPGHHLASVVQLDSKPVQTRTELIPDR